MNIKEVAKKYGVTQDTLRYYEKVKMIPPVTRTPSGIRNYQPEDLRWVELAVCTRNAGLQVDAMVKYVQLFQQGDSSIPQRLQLLQQQMDILIKQKESIEETMKKLSYKIDRYKQAIKTGTLTWEEDK